MQYFNCVEIRRRVEWLEHYANLLAEYGGDGNKTAAEIEKLMATVNETLERIKASTAALAENADEPNGYDAIVAASEGGNTPVPVENLSERIKGAMVARFAGCVLGVPVENWPVEEMRNKAQFEGAEFPPQYYWKHANNPWDQHCFVQWKDYTVGNMTYCPSDDDITYTMIALPIMEKYGLDFTVADVGEFWADHLPLAYTAEEIAIKNLKAGIPAELAGETDNPYSNWIGALIRADGFAYACAGDPHKAARLAYNDAYLTHRRNGIYGEMLFAAAIAAAFTTNDGIEAIRIGLREIPKTSMLYADICWALENLDNVKSYADARRLVDERFAGQNRVHTDNNACLIVFGVHLGAGDVTRAISETVAMGYDNDCTAATVGSITGAIAGFSAIEEKWYKPFNNTVKTYIKDFEFFDLDDAVARFVALNK